MKNKVVNSCLVVAVVVILIVFAVYVRIGATADAVAVIKTSGMSCGMCASQVTKALESQRGVASTEVDVARGVVIAGYDSKQVAPAKLVQTVTEAGFDSKLQAVMTPEQFRKAGGRELGQRPAGSGCCGSKGCGGK
jgi:copper chaperone CopZ